MTKASMMSTCRGAAIRWQCLRVHSSIWWKLAGSRRRSAWIGAVTRSHAHEHHVSGGDHLEIRDRAPGMRPGATVRGMALYMMMTTKIVAKVPLGAPRFNIPGAH